MDSVFPFPNIHLILIWEIARKIIRPCKETTRQTSISVDEKKKSPEKFVSILLSPGKKKGNRENGRGPNFGCPLVYPAGLALTISRTFFPSCEHDMMDPLPKYEPLSRNQRMIWSDPRALAFSKGQGLSKIAKVRTGPRVPMWPIVICQM